MTTITKERALKQLDGIKEAFTMSFVRGYIDQLEAQRQPVSDEKLTEKYEALRCTALQFLNVHHSDKMSLSYACSVAQSNFPQTFTKNIALAYEAALSELETLRTKNAQLEADAAKEYAIANEYQTLAVKLEESVKVLEQQIDNSTKKSDK